MTESRVSRRALLMSGGGGVMASGLMAAAPVAGANQSAAAAIPATGMAVVTLGTAAGPAIRGPRNGIATAVVVDGNLYLVDCGLGTARQATTAGLTMDKLQAVFLTHLHSDHIAELPALFLYNWGPAVNGIVTPVDIVGPAAARLPRGARAHVTPPVHGTRRLIEDLVDAYAYDINIRVYDEGRDPLDDLLRPVEIDLPRGVKARPERIHPDMEPIEVWADDHVRVSAVLVHHPPVYPAFGFRFDSAHGSVTISGDTTVSANLVRLAQRTDVLVHEAIDVAYYLGRGLPEDYVRHIAESHTDITEVGKVATAARCDHLVLSHLGGIFTDADAAPARADFTGPVTVADDREVFVV